MIKRVIFIVVAAVLSALAIYGLTGITSLNSDIVTWSDNLPGGLDNNIVVSLCGCLANLLIIYLVFKEHIAIKIIALLLGVANLLAITMSAPLAIVLPYLAISFLMLYACMLSTFDTKKKSSYFWCAVGSAFIVLLILGALYDFTVFYWAFVY